MFNIEEELKQLPAKPGVYIMRDKTDKIIYVGKAVVLKNRVRSYFQNSRNHTEKIRQMVENIDHFEYIITDSELEALVLECNLIKEHMPKYNTKLKDDKAYPFIRVTIDEAFPKVSMVREIKKDKAKYYGPYISILAVTDTLDLLRKIYKIRTCSRNLPKDIGKERACLYYHMGQCDAPCEGYISKEDYRANILEVLEFLNGNYTRVVKQLEEKMEKASEELEFEKAAEYRDLISNVKKVADRQKITNTDQLDRDIIAFAKEKDEAVVQTFFIRNGKMIGRDNFHLGGVADVSDGEIMANFLKQFYAGTPYIPKEIFLDTATEEEELLTDWLSAKRGQRVYIKVPQKGDKEKLVELAKKNAELILHKDIEKIKREEAKTTGALKELAGFLKLPMIERIESYDISNTSGFESVGSMVVYEKGKPKKADYRKFKLRTVIGPDDYQSMYEVLTRRFSHAKKELEQLGQRQQDPALGSFTRLPDLILMDGGKGQVGIALKVLEEQQLDIAVCGMVKDDNHHTRGLYYNNQELPIDKSSELFKLITRIQDETHRFAIEYHRSLRNKKQVKSILDDINGIGPKRRRALMKHFMSLEAIQAASEEELMQVPTMNSEAAKKVYAFFHQQKSE